MATAVRRFFSVFEPNANVTATTTAVVAAANFHPFRVMTWRRLIRRYSSSSASVIADDHTLTTSAAGETAGDSQQHPWPEWVNFVDRLKTKGYINQIVGNDVADYKDMSLLRASCLSFGRDRFDLFKSLSMQDVQALVENGCPNIHRKTVNSGKRLRAHLQLDEANACGVCIFRGSCDRANAILKDVEFGAQTVDIVRILLNYALYQVVDSDKKPFGAEVVSTSAKKLLLELTELSDTQVDEMQKPAAPGTWMCPKCNFLNSARNKKCLECDEDGPQKAGNEDVEMKKGNWICPECTFMNFSRNIRCIKCETEGPKSVETTDIEMKKGDWNCPRCSFKNPFKNIRCMKCKKEAPKRVVGINDTEMKKGDWNCPKCNFMNFSRNSRCSKCKTEGPKRVGGTNDIETKKGEWNCPKCNFMNFSRNIQCLKCKTEGPKRVVAKKDIEMKKGDWNCPKCQFMNFASNTKCLRCEEHCPKRLLNARKRLKRQKITRQRSKRPLHA